MSDIIEVLKSYMRDDLDIDTSKITSETLLVSEGVIDSFSLIALLTFIESTFKFRAGATDLNLANFDSLDRIHRYIEMCKA
ncbi:MAG: acyl carrier protein [Halioglobus sp.]|jgi:acyl carrier protein